MQAYDLAPGRSSVLVSIPHAGTAGSGETIRTTEAIKAALQGYRNRIGARHHFYSQDLINTLSDLP